MHKLYPEIQPFETFYLSVSDGHELYVERVGNPKGQPVVFLHGGPGGGFSENHRRLFDPEHYHIILFDQRGAGKSRPYASLENNTTWHLLADMEQLRKRLTIDKWLLFGGSWGSTLALAYATKYPQYVSGLILRGIFLCRPEEIQWFYQAGCHWIYPDFWSQFLSPVMPAEQNDMIGAYYRLLTSDKTEVRLNAAKAWSRWEGATSKLIPNEQQIASFEDLNKAEAMARIECHYFVNHCFFPEPNYLLNQTRHITHLPMYIVHGRYDVICPVKNAYDLKEKLPHASLFVIPDAGHSYDEPGILSKLLEATEVFKQVLGKPLLLN